MQLVRATIGGGCGNGNDLVDETMCWACRDRCFYRAYVFNQMQTLSVRISRGKNVGPICSTDGSRRPQETLSYDGWRGEPTTTYRSSEVKGRKVRGGPV